MIENVTLLIATAGLIVGSAYAVASRKLFKAVLGFAVSMLFLGGIYFVLNQRFFALIHIIVYVGGVAVMALFAYITSISAEEVEESARPFNWLAFMAAAATFVLLLAAGLKMLGGISLNSYKPISAFLVGRVLLGSRLFEFEVVSVLLLVALLASIAIAVGGKKE